MRALLARVTDDGVRGPAAAALDELTTARDELAGAAGDPERVAAAMASLEATFTRLAGVPPTRRAGELYAGRTIAYEECLRGDTVRVGADTLDSVRRGAGPGARQLAMVRRGLCRRLCPPLRRGLPPSGPPRSAPMSCRLPSSGCSSTTRCSTSRRALIEPVVSALQQRWSAILDLPAGGRRIQVRAADLRAAGGIAVPGPAAAVADGGVPQPRPDDRRSGRRRWRPAHLGARRDPSRHHRALRRVAGGAGRPGRLRRGDAARPERTRRVAGRDRRAQRRLHAAVQ